MLARPRTARRRDALALALVPLVLSVAPAPDEDDPPKLREQEDLVERYFELHDAARSKRAEQAPLLARLASVELDADDEEDWREELIDLWEDGPELEGKSGRHWFWDDDDGERGLYIVKGDTRRPEGLMIGMHGGGVGSGDANSSASVYASSLNGRDWVGIFPEVLEKTEHGWTTSGTEEFVLELIERGRRTFGVPADRVYLAGHSMGGYGSWTLGARHADRVAGLAPSAGAPTPVRRGPGEPIFDIDWGVIPNLRNTRIVIYQSIDDPRVPPDVNQFAVKQLEAAREKWGGYDFEYWEVDGRGHDFPEGGPDAHFAKIEDARRIARPEKLVWQPVLPWKRQFHWLAWDAPVKTAIVVAELDREANKLTITVDKDPTGLALLLDDELLDTQREVTVVLNGAETVYPMPERSLAVLVETGVTGDPGLTFGRRLELAPRAAGSTR